MKSLPVLMYHDIHNQIYNQYMVVHPNKFYHDMQYIKNNFTTICINDLLNYIYHGVPLPPKCIMITFDDAYSGVYRHAYNILTDLKMKATVSVIVKRINNPTVYEIKKLNWLQMKEMYDSGYIDFQSHSYDMHEPQSINVNQRVGCLIKDGEDIDQYAKKFIEDYLRSKQEIENNIHNNVLAYFYPYGKYNILSEEILKHIPSCSMSFSCDSTIYKQPNVIIPNDSSTLWAIDRLSVSYDTVLSKLKYLKY